jgi:hypothetical protein
MKMRYPQSRTVSVVVCLQLLMWILNPCPGAGAAGIPTVSATQEGFVSIFNGKDLSGWQGEPNVWSVKDGVLTGYRDAADKVDSTFLIWTNGVVKDFELHFMFRVPQANSGVAYRAKDFGKGAVFGYQYVLTDMRSKHSDIGQLFESGARVNQTTTWVSGRGLLGPPGAKVRIEPGRVIRPDGISSVTAVQALSTIKPTDWNEGVVIARQHQLTHFINGVVVTEVRDLDSTHSSLSGVIALGSHPSRDRAALAQFKDIRVKELTNEPPRTGTVAAATPKRPVADRLKELKELYSQGLIDKETYDQKTKAILDSL